MRAIAVISPAMEFRGLKCDTAMHAFAARSGAALLAAGSLIRTARDPRDSSRTSARVRDLHLSTNVANGRALLPDQPDLAGALVDWFRRTLL